MVKKKKLNNDRYGACLHDLSFTTSLNPNIEICKLVYLLLQRIVNFHGRRLFVLGCNTALELCQILFQIQTISQFEKLRSRLQFDTSSVLLTIKPMASYSTWCNKVCMASYTYRAIIKDISL